MIHRSTHLWQFALLLAFMAALGTTEPVAAQARPYLTPVQPLSAWEVAPDGGVYVLDATQHIYKLDAQTLAPLAVSNRLTPVISTGRAQMVAHAGRLYVRGEQFDGISVLDGRTLAQIEWLPVDAEALAVEEGKRLLIVERRPAPLLEGMYTLAVISLPLDDLHAEPQEFGVTASQPFSSLYDLVVDRAQGLLYVGYLDAGGSPNRHYRTYRAYDLQSGEEVDMGLPHQSASTALRPVLTASGTAAVSYKWEGVYPQQERIYLLNRGQKPVTVENVSGPLALDEQGHWLYLVRERGLWELENYRDADYFLLHSVVPFLQPPPADVRLSADGQTIYLFGNGWLGALAADQLHVTGIEFVTPFPTAWTSQAGGAAQTARMFTAADQGEVALVNLQPSGEWYRSASTGKTWQLLAAVLQPRNLKLERLSLSPALQSDGVIIARGDWRNNQRIFWRSQDGGMNWVEWQPPIAYVAGGEQGRTLYVAYWPDPLDASSAEPQSVPVGGSTENPAWSPGWTHLAFQNNSSGDWEIYRVPADCRAERPGPSSAAKECDVQQLTDSAGDDLLPAWSPDGRTIAFVSLRDGNPEIYVMLADGSQQTRLTFSPGGDWRPAWLPDSRHLVFTSNRAGNNDIFLLELPPMLGEDNKGEAALISVVASPADERDPAVSGDGELLFLSDRDGVMQPYAADLTAFLASSSRTPLTGSPVLQGVTAPVGHPGWLPDGDLLFAAAGGVYRAPRYAGPDQWQEVDAAAAGALHPAPGPTWYWPEPWRGY